MARIRTIKPDFWRDESLAKISTEACLLAIGLLNHCDDEGFFNANPKLVESDIFPLRELSSTTTVLLQELYKIGYVLMFQGSDGKTYGKVSNFEKHQVINKRTPSKIKDLCELLSDYGGCAVSLPTGMEGKGKEKEKEWKKEKNTVAPPDGVTDIVWQDWLTLRKAKKAAVTQTALNGIIKEAGKAGINLQAALETCCARGWTGFKAEWLKDKDAGQKSFAEKEYDFKRERWEAMTGRTPQAEIKSYNFMEIEDDTTH